MLFTLGSSMCFVGLGKQTWKMRFFVNSCYGQRCLLVWLPLCPNQMFSLSLFCVVVLGQPCEVSSLYSFSFPRYPCNIHDDANEPYSFSFIVVSGNEALGGDSSVHSTYVQYVDGSPDSALYAATNGQMYFSTSTNTFPYLLFFLSFRNKPQNMRPDFYFLSIIL